MNKKILYRSSFIVAILFMGGPSLVVSAQETESEKNQEQVQANILKTEELEKNNESTLTIKGDLLGGEKEVKNKNEKAGKEENLLFTTNGKQEDANTEKDSDQYLNRYNKVINELSRIAELDTEIRDEVKKISSEEKDSSEKVSEKIKEVEVRGKIKTFLLGSDYKNLGEIRSEIATTENRINRLNKTLEKTINEEVKKDLKAQIIELESIQAKTNEFVKSEEEKFSLFGWFVKMLNK